MRYRSIFALTFLIIPFFVTSNTTAEIFELVNSYEITGEMERDIFAADCNNDGLVDFIVVSDSSYMTIPACSWYEVFLSNGDCSFMRLGAVINDSSDVGQLLLGDFNEDSNEDLLLMSLEDTWFYAGDGAGSFNFTSLFPWSLCNGCTGDVNNDGHLDIVGIQKDSWIWWETYGDSIIVMLGNGTGSFTEGWVYDEDPGSYGYYSCQLAYFDNSDTDSILDLCVPTCDEFLVFQGVGDGTFSYPEYYTAYPGTSYQTFCASGDFDEDGYNDIAISGNASMSSLSTLVFLNQQDGTFLQEGDGYFQGACNIIKIVTADLNLDGHLDLSVAGSIAGYGDGTFNGEMTELLSSIPGADFVFIDMDLDGDLDLVGYWGGIYRNTTIMQGCEGEADNPAAGIFTSSAPNPFSASVSIKVSGYSDVSGNLQIFDLSGRMVAELEPVSSNGEAVFHWNGVSSSGAELPSGIYTARVYSGDTAATVTLLKLE